MLNLIKRLFVLFFGGFSSN